MPSICPNKTDIGNVKQQRLSIMIETNRIEFKRELTDDLDIEKEIKMLLCTGCFPIGCKQNTQQL